MVEEAAEPLSFADAVKSKYADYEPKLFDNIQLSPKRRAALVNKQGHHQRRILALDGCKVGSAGQPGQISEICPNLTELDMTNNCLQCWEQVFKIICQLPKLKFLNLSSNPLHCSFNEDKINRIVENNMVPRLKNLVLNNTKLPFELIFKVLSLFPEVEELHLSLNGYGCVAEWPHTFPSVKKLHFNSNDLHDWEDVMRIGKIFPSLRSLVLCGNFIKEVNFKGKPNVFSKLEILSLSKTEINNWTSLGEICKLPLLSDLRLVGVPLGRDEDEAKKRQLFISRLPNIVKLNGSNVDDNEREDAERVFIRHYMDSDCPPARYHELVKVHGQLNRLAEVDMSAEEPVLVRLRMEDWDLGRVVVDLSTNVRTLKRVIGKKVNLKPKDFRMWLIALGQPAELSQPSAFLSKYRVREGDEILVQRLQKFGM